MRVTVCELPHEPVALMVAWSALCEHTTRHASELVLLPEFAMVEPVWESEHFGLARWSAAESLGECWLARLPELHATYVVGTRPVTIESRRFNQGYVASATDEVVPLRRKFFLPDEAGGWEANWFEPGDADFPVHHVGALSFALNICTELWAVENYGVYARCGVQAILSPRATAATTAKWLAVGVVAAVRSGAFSLSSNRVDPTGACGGTGWIVSPDGELLATTTREEPFATVDIDLNAPIAARGTYPRYVFM
ncbi:MAG: carbon-nitrogen hydrolase family protein [Gemmatimonadota bacterium]